MKLLLAEIDESFNLAVLDARSFVAFENEEFKLEALAQWPRLNDLHKQLEAITVTEEDKAYARDLRGMIDYYFIDRLPETFAFIKAGQKDEAIQKTQAIGFEKVKNVLESIVTNMCEVINADRGIITMLNEDAIPRGQRLFN